VAAGFIGIGKKSNGGNAFRQRGGTLQAAKSPLAKGKRAGFEV